MSLAELWVAENVLGQGVAGACPVTGVLPLCAAPAGSTAGLHRQGLHFPLCNFPSTAVQHGEATTERGGATTLVARCWQGAMCNTKLTLPGPPWGSGLEVADCWLTTSSSAEDLGAEETRAARDSA